MSKVIILSRNYPSYHPRVQQKTLFVEKFLKAFEHEKWYADHIYKLGQILGYDYVDSMLQVCDSVPPKYHTIRGGKRWKVGDTFSPRIWSGIPYRSPMITIAPDITIEKTFDFEIIHAGCVYVDDKNMWADGNIEELAKNDGLEVKDLLEWFKFPTEFDGQIICWNKKIQY